MSDQEKELDEFERGCQFERDAQELAEQQAAFRRRRRYNVNLFGWNS